MKQDSSWYSEEKQSDKNEVEDIMQEYMAIDMLTPVLANYPQRTVIPRGRAILLAVFLLILVLNATRIGSAQFIGAEGWAFVLGGPVISKGDPNLLKNVANQLRTKLAPRATAQAVPHFTPQEYLDALVQNMTLDQKLGQMIIVQFVEPEYLPDSTPIITNYTLGAAIL